MSAIIVGLIGLFILFVLLALRMPVGLAMMTVGFFGIWSLNSFRAALSTLGSEAYVISTNFNLIVLPLFVLMGNLATTSGMSSDLYRLAYAVVGRLKGGLASATIIGCAGFAALSGSSLASAITMGRVAIPEMKAYHYSDGLATGSVAAGGTLGILIPPSTGFILYAILTEQSIGQLFMAGVLPGILLCILFLLAISIVTFLHPEAGPVGPPTTLAEKFQSLRRALPILIIIVGSIGGIYTGLFTPSEASGIGAFAAFIVAIARITIDLDSLVTVLLQTGRTTAMVFLILIGAHVLTPFLALSHIPDALAMSLLSLELTPMGTLLIILATYVVLGTFLEGIAMLVHTLPIVFPLVTTLGFDPIWFGVVVVIVLEMGLISPPVGMNVYMVKSIAEEVPLSTIFKGIIPFWIAMFICLFLLILFPQIALYLPGTM